MKRRIVFAVVFALIACVLFLRYQGRLLKPAAGHRSGPPEYSDPARPIETRVGQDFVISLESNPTTGYGWRFSGKLDKNTVKVVEIRHQRQKTDRVGAGGWDQWTLQGLREGTLSIPLEYVRPWEKDVPPVKKAVFTIIVKK